jgi:biopolymer transport protein ExbD
MNKRLKPVNNPGGIKDSSRAVSESLSVTLGFPVHDSLHPGGSAGLTDQILETRLFKIFRTRLKLISYVAVAAFIASIAIQIVIQNGVEEFRAPRKKDLRTVEVKSDGSFLFAGMKMDLNAIEAALVEAFRKNSRLAVAIRADTKEDYADVMKLLAICQRNGIFKIGLSTRNE